MSIGSDTRRGLGPLLALNFFMADMQAGIGPFLGVFLLAHGWQSGLIGTVMTVGGVAGMLMTTPAGALVDATTRKQALRHRSRHLHRHRIRRSCCYRRISGWSRRRRSRPRSPELRSARRSPASRSASCVRPASTARTGTTRPSTTPATWSAPALSGLLGWQFGFPAVFWLAAAFGVLSIALGADDTGREPSTTMPRAACTDEGGNTRKSAASGYSLECKPLLILAAALALFHLGNARDAAALRHGRRRKQARRPGGLRRDYHRGGARHDDPGLDRGDAHGRKGRLLAGAADFVSSHFRSAAWLPPSV